MPLFSPKGLNATAEIHQEVLRYVIKPWMDKITDGHPYLFQQHSGLANKAKTTQV